jgi:hypothetical protein
VALYSAGSIFTLLLDDRKPFSCGANDNAASIGVALEVGARLVQNPLKHTQVWLAFTGAEETDHAGLKRLLAEQDPVLRQAVFLCLEGLGGGEIVYLVSQGLCVHYRPDPETLAFVEKVVGGNPHLAVRPSTMTMEDEVRTLRGRGYKAICITGRDPLTGSLPHWHRLDDTVDSVSGLVMEKASDFVETLVRELDHPA